MPISDELKRVIAIIDGSDKCKCERNDIGFYFNPQSGCQLVVPTDQAPGLATAVRGELAIFGKGQLAFGVALRLCDAEGGVSPWVSCDYSWHSDPGKWPVAPIADPRLVPLEERFLRIVSIDDAGQSAERTMPLEASFAWKLHNRIDTSRNANNFPGWLKLQREQIARMIRDGIEQHAWARCSSGLLPVSSTS